MAHPPMTQAELLALPTSFKLWPTAGRAFGLGRSATFELAKRGEFPCRVLRLGGKCLVTRADLFRALGEPVTADSDNGSGSAA